MPGVIYDDPRYKYDEVHLLYDGGWVTTGSAAFRVGGRGGVAALKGASWAAALRAQAQVATPGHPQKLAVASLAEAVRSATIGTRQSSNLAWLASRVETLVDCVRSSQGLVLLSGGTAVQVPVIPGRLGALSLWSSARSAATYGPKAIVSYARLVAISRSTGAALAVRPPPPTLLPLDPLALVDLGHVYRGDTLILPLWQARDQRGNLLDLTDALIWFTAKQELVDPDLEPPTIQVSTADGWVTIVDAEAAIYRVVVPPHETQELPYDAFFTFDVQVQWDSPVIRTIRRGVLAVVCDVTRALA